MFSQRGFSESFRSLSRNLNSFFKQLKTREDFIQHMIEVEKDDDSNVDSQNSDENISNLKLKKTLTFNEILCTAVLFLSAGYETTANTLCFIAYSLATNPDLQEKVCNEVDQILDKHVYEFIIKIFITDFFIKVFYKIKGRQRDI
jgi:cytochrome P450